MKKYKKGVNPVGSSTIQEKGLPTLKSEALEAA
jgi:hypothetical protein